MDPAVDNMLKITGEGRKAALDMRLMDPKLELQTETKIDRAVSRMVKIWKTNASLLTLALEDAGGSQSRPRPGVSGTPSCLLIVSCPLSSSPLGHNLLSNGAQVTSETD